MYLTTVIVTRPACTLRPVCFLFVCLFVFLSHAIKVRDDDILSLFSLLKATLFATTGGGGYQVLNS
jgi:hypothetical protein